MSLMAALCVNLMTVNMLLSVFFLSDVSARCESASAGLFITTPKEMEALSGSCLLIPCNFSPKQGTEFEFDSRREIYGVWIKSDTSFHTYPQNVIFNSRRSHNSYKMTMTGNLREQNCTTLFSDLDESKTNKYFFRIENEPFKATACYDPLQITVRDSPWSPRISISGEVKEKKSVTISCSAFTPCPHSPPQLTWNLQQNSHRQIEENTDGTFTSQIQQNIILSDSHDGFNISCSATYPVGEGKPGKTKETQQTLSVKYAPKDTNASISPSGLVSAGSWMNLSCSSRANPPISSFSWFLKTRNGTMKVAEGQFYQFNAAHGRVYYCEATNILGTQRSAEIHLNVEDTLLLISPTDPVSVGSVVNLTCSCEANPPTVHFVWFMISKGRLEIINTHAQVYSFTVTSNDRDRLFYCGCRNHLDSWMSRGQRLTFEGGTPVSVQVILKTLGIILLVSTLILFECVFRLRFSNKPAVENFDMSSSGAASLPNK